MNFPTDHANCGLTLPLDYAGMRKVLNGPDLVFLVGGRFFEEVWFDHGSPFPNEAKVVQLENNAENVGFNFPVDLGIVADTASSLSALTGAAAAIEDSSFTAAVSQREERLRRSSEERMPARNSTPRKTGIRPRSQSPA